MRLVFRSPIYLLLFSTILLPHLLFGKSTTDSLLLRVLDEKEQPLIGVNVISIDGSFENTTNVEGEVVIYSNHPEAIFTFSYIGYQDLQLSFHSLFGSNGVLKMKLGQYTLPSITTIGRRDDQLLRTPQQIQVISSADIASTVPSTTADMLQQHGNLFVQKSQLGGGSPIIRGFEANRVLLVIDGVRMNNAIYRSGHLQNAITVDGALLEQTEVLFGPNSLMYGSDALGGVIHFRSRSPKLNLGSSSKAALIEGHYYTRYATAEQSTSTHFDLNVGFKKWAFLTSITYNDFGDLIAGHIRPDQFPGFAERNYFVKTVNGIDQVVSNINPNEQIGTAYKQLDFVQKIRFQPNDTYYLDVNFQLSTSSDIPRYDQLTELTGIPNQFNFAEWYYGPQNRQLLSTKARLLESNALFDRGTLIAAIQRIEEDRYQRKFGNPWREASLIDLNIWSFNADFDKYLANNEASKLAYGFEVTHNDVFSDAYANHISSGEIHHDVNARYPSEGSALSSFGTYLNYHWQSPDTNFHFNAGARYSATALYAKFGSTGPVEWPAIYQSGIRSHNDAFTYAAGVHYMTPQDWVFKMSFGTAFRAPNIDDFAKVREKNGFITVPNPGLKPEKSVTGELTIAKQLFGTQIGDKAINEVQFSATGFYTRLNQAIVRSNFALPDGAPYFISRGDTLYTQANVNADFANIYGVSGNLRVDFSEQWQLSSSFNLVKGERSLKVYDDNGNMVHQEMVPQDHIPPIYGQTAFKYRGKKLDLEAVIRYNGKKRARDYAINDIELDVTSECGQQVVDRTGTADNLEYGATYTPNSNCASTYYGVYSWTTFNFYSTWRFSKFLSLQVGLENITDKHYRLFASGVSAPGRNLLLTLRGKF